jgi:uncharacterized protein DUF998
LLYRGEHFRRAQGVTPRTIWLARAVIVAQIVFTAAWIIGGVLEDAAYSSARDDISDLGALTAHLPWVWLVPQGITGVLTIAFALGALRPALSVAGHREPISTWLTAFSLMGLDNLTDPLFRLDCRAADSGCTAGMAATSWPGTIHVVVGIVAALATVVAPFALARRMRLLNTWRDLAPGAIAFGVTFLILTVLYAVLNGRNGSGYAQRASCLLVSAGVVILARRVMALAGSVPHPITS